MDEVAPPTEQAPAEPVAPAEAEPHNGWRFYIGGGQAQVPNGTGDAGELGFDRVTDGDHVRATLGGSVLVVSGAGEELKVPLWGADLALRFRAGRKLAVYASGGAGCHFLLVLPMPSAKVALGLEIPLGAGPVLDFQVGLRETFAWSMGIVPVATGQLGVVMF